RNGVDADNSLTTLHYCAGSALRRPEVLEIAKRLIADGADPTAKASLPGHGVTPIKLATRNQRVAELLLDHGADPNDVFGNVLLSSCPDFTFADCLMSRGADLNRISWAGETLLHVAIHWGRLTSASWLLEKGANPNTARDKDAWTPLHQAASRGVASIIATLLESGANPAARDRNGDQPIDV